MADDPTERPHRPPVHMGLRVLARHSAGRHGGRQLAHSVVEARTPKLLPSSVRLAEGTRSASVARAPMAPPPPPGWSAAEPSAAAAPAPGASASVARSPEPAAAESSRPSWAPSWMSDFAAQWMFGDQSAASEGLMTMDAAAKMPEPTKEQRIARFIARGGLERSRGARIVEGAGSGPIPASELGASGDAEPQESEPRPMKLARTPAGETP